MYANTSCNLNNNHKEFIKRTSNSRQSSHAPGSAGLLTSFWHPHEAVDMLLCILQRKLKGNLGTMYKQCTCGTVIACASAEFTLDHKLKTNAS